MPPTFRNRVGRLVDRARYSGSTQYWEERYRRGGTSGSGSRGALAAFKARVINGLVDEYNIRSVVELGCGDGEQLALARYDRYLGLDVSSTAIQMCRNKFRDDQSKSFMLYEPHTFTDPARFIHAELALSVDVLFHLTEPRVFELHLQHLFALADRLVLIYATDIEQPSPYPHEQRREFTGQAEAIAPGWRLVRRIPNEHPFAGDEELGSDSEFFLYVRREG